MKEIIAEWRKFKKCLLEGIGDSNPCNKSEISYAWISPNGEIFKCSDFQSPSGNKGHMVAAMEIIAKYYLDDPSLPEDFAHNLEVIEYDPYETRYTREEFMQKYPDENIDDSDDEEDRFRGEHVTKTRRWEAGRDMSQFGDEYMFHEADAGFQEDLLRFMFSKGFIRMANAYNYEAYLIDGRTRKDWDRLFGAILKTIKNCPNAQKEQFYFDLKSEDGYSTRYSIKDVSLEEFLNWMGKVSKI